MTKTEFYIHAGQATKDRRTQIGLTQEQLAKKAGIPRPAISGLEKGHYHPTAYRLYQIAQALEISVLALFPPSEFDPKSKPDPQDDVRAKYAELFEDPDPNPLFEP